MSTPTIIALNRHPTVHFAAAELSRCLQLATGRAIPVAHEDSAEAECRIRLGVSGDCAEIAEFDTEGDADAIDIQVTEAGGIIGGSNPRSVLIAVYRYLRELGCCWVRPGDDGEYVPALRMPLPAVNCRETPSYRHRGICIEGAVSLEHVTDMVDWMPKLGFNTYFIQFREAFNFFQRWYEHTGNPTMESTPFTIEDARRLTATLREQIKLRDASLHMTGHGWTCEPFGIPGPGWFQHEGSIPEAAVQHLAEVKGKRELWGGVALNTNLCYGNQETRDIVTDAIVSWAAENPDVDVIHFWLADGTNNHCECAKCRETRPSDLYVRMLNELDRKLTQAACPVKIVFLVYVDLLWPPREEVIANQDRFILMFAPITRSYSSPFPVSAKSDRTLPPYERNALSFPKDPAMNLNFLSAWQRMFPGDGFDFDYHFMWDHHKDPGQYSMAKVLHQDCANLKAIGLDGMVSCQNQRVFFPTGLGMTVMGETLWNRTRDFDDIAAAYFSAAFGDKGESVRRYLKSVSERFNPRVLRGEGSTEEKAAAPTQLDSIPELVDSMRTDIHDGMNDSNPCRAASWRYLDAHADFIVRFAEALSTRLRGTEDEARGKVWELFSWCRENEPRLHTVFDVFEFQITIAPLFGLSRNEVQ